MAPDMALSWTVGMRPCLSCELSLLNWFMRFFGPKRETSCWLVGAIAKFGSFKGDGFFVAYPLFRSRFRKDFAELNPAKFFDELKML